MPFKMHENKMGKGRISLKLGRKYMMLGALGG